MPFEQHTVVGQGVQAFTNAQFAWWVAISCTPGGPAHPMDASDPARWMDLGWWGLYEDFLADPNGIPDGRYLLDPQFIQSVQSIVNLHNAGNAFDPTGVNGFRFFLMPGVTAVFTFFYP